MSDEKDLVEKWELDIQLDDFMHIFSEKERNEISFSLGCKKLEKPKIIVKDGKITIENAPQKLCNHKIFDSENDDFYLMYFALKYAQAYQNLAKKYTELQQEFEEALIPGGKIAKACESHFEDAAGSLSDFKEDS